LPPTPPTPPPAPVTRIRPGSAIVCLPSWSIPHPRSYAG